jgi:flagellar basal body rod protein FlgB
MSKEYILHGTNNIIKILNDGYINNSILQKNLYMLDKSSGQIFTQDENIAIKDLPFYATNIGGFLDNFQLAFTEKEKMNKIILTSSGHLSKKPNVKKLKKHIITIFYT